MRRYKRKILVVAGIIVFSVGIKYLLSIESKNEQLLSQQQSAQVTVNPSLDSLSSKQHILPNMLQVTHFDPIFIGYMTPAAPTQKTINNPAVVQKIYNAMLALPKVHSNVQLCTFDPALVTNELRFFTGNRLILHATIFTGGCSAEVVIDENDLNRFPEAAFLSLLANSLGVTKHELFKADRKKSERINVPLPTKVK